eukprot:TRINITY_DN1014_c0_g1_i3.p1 TRINITY_DN1014_c0_g1~~TRINITY_DN1014_c0_g1_i3.p1  ORF type:complete len:821 (+),score=219.25 TRINITY_DN1014_c0_g1_i3:134-2464(+)
MLKNLTDLIADSIKKLPLPQPKKMPSVNITSAVFEYMPIQLLAKHKKSQEINQLCLLICTDIALELWVFQDFKQFNQVFRKAEASLQLARYLPVDRGLVRADKISPLGKCLKNSVPILAILKSLDEFSSLLGIALFSLRTLQYFHVLRFSEPLANFIVSPYYLVALLCNGELQVFDLNTLELTNIILTVVDSDLPVLNTAAIHKENVSMSEEVIPVCDISDNILGYVKYDKNFKDKFDGLAAGVMKSNIVGNYAFVKHAAKKVINWSEYGYKEVKKLFNIRKATKLERDDSPDIKAKGEERHKESPNHTPNKNRANHRKDSYEDDVYEDDFEEDLKEQKEEEFVEITQAMIDEVEEKIKSRFSIAVVRMNDTTVLATIVPPYFLGVSQLKFSPSGSFLLVVNESGQHFYVYKLFPETNQRHQNTQSQKNTLLVYSIFRGYTSAKVSCISFSLCETWLIVNSNKGTSHIYRLEQNWPFPKQTTGIVKLTAFGRFKYEKKTSLAKDIKPVTSIVSHYPIDMLGTKKEVLKRMGVSLFNSLSDESSEDVPLFVTVTSEGEVYTNSLMIFKAQSTGMCNYHLIAGLRDKVLAKIRGVDNKSVLLVETVANFSLRFETRSKKLEAILDKNVIPKVKEEINYSKIKDDLSSSSIEYTMEEINNTKMQQWLKQVVIIPFTQFHKEKITIKHCTWKNKPIKAKENTSANDTLYEELLSHEAVYAPIESAKTELDLRGCLESEKNAAEEIEESESVEVNPFEDDELDKELEKRIVESSKYFKANS